MEPIALIVGIAIFIGVTATAQESVLEKREKIRKEKTEQFYKAKEKEAQKREEQIEANRKKREQRLKERAAKNAQSGS